MSSTPATLASVLKERWTDDDLQKGYIADDSLMAEFSGFKSTMIGRQAQTPVWGVLNSGGFTVISSAGGASNPASNQTSAQAVWTMPTQVFPIGLEFAALNQSDDAGLLSVISGKNQEIRGALDVLNRQGARQISLDGSGKVAACDTSGGSTVVPLIAASGEGAAWGFQALDRDWLSAGAVVDVGTTADTDTLVTGTTVSAISRTNPAAPTITIGTSITTTNGTHFVYIANPNSTSAANPETNGLRNIINTTGAVGGRNPATAGQEDWTAAFRDTSTTVLSIDLLLNMTRAIKQRSGEQMSDTWLGLKQQMNLYALLQNQVRFAGDLGLSTGNVDTVTWAGQRVKAFQDILDTDVFCITKSDLLRVTGRFEKAKWASDVFGGNEMLAWHQGNSDGQDQIMYAWQLGCRRRNTHAGATALTA
jgi:hypothetical protein